MNKLINVFLFILIGLALFPIIGSMVEANKVEANEITYTITSTSDVVSHDLSNDDFDYIIDNYEIITGHDDLEFITSGVASYSSISDETTHILINFTNSQMLAFTSATRVLTNDGDTSLIEGSQTVTIYFEDIPVTGAVVSLVSIIPIIVIISIVAGTVLYFKNK